MKRSNSSRGGWRRSFSEHQTKKHTPKKLRVNNKERRKENRVDNTTTKQCRRAAWYSPQLRIVYQISVTTKMCTWYVYKKGNTQRGRERGEEGGGGRRKNVTHSPAKPKIHQVPLGTRYRTSSALCALRILRAHLRLYTERSWMIARHCIPPPSSRTDTRYNTTVQDRRKNIQTKTLAAVNYSHCSALSHERRQENKQLDVLEEQGVCIGRTSDRNYWLIYWPGQSVDYSCQYILSQCPALQFYYVGARKRDTDYRRHTTTS